MKFYIGFLLFEIDGWYHNETHDYDEERSKWLSDNHNIKIVRFTNDEVENNLDWVVECMKKIVKDREKEFKNLTPANNLT